MKSDLALDREIPQIPDDTFPVIRKHHGTRALGIIALVLLCFTLIEILFFVQFDALALVNRHIALYSICFNIATILLACIVLVANVCVQRSSRSSDRFYYYSMHFIIYVVLADWIVHIHFGGASFTPLCMLIPLTAFMVSWLLGPRESWIFFGVGTAIMVLLMILEKTAVLPFFPINAQADRMPLDLFLDPRYMFMRLLIYAALSVTVLWLINRFQNSIRQRNKELKELSRQLRYLATTDPLTGLMNRRTAMAHLDRELDRAQRRNAGMLIAMVDLDDFKHINDSYGHAAGDTVLKQVSSIFKKHMRRYDLVARIGGEEFLLAIADDTGGRGRQLIERIRAALERHRINVDGNGGLGVTASFGCTAYEPQKPRSLDRLLKTADDALYQSKRQGKNRVTCVQ